MKSFKTFLGLLLAIITLTVVTSAATINVPADYATIQAAVNAANGGDIINIAAGTYTENVIITGAKNGITIQGVGPTTILDGTGLANPRIGFKIQSDNITIKDLKIQDYVYTGTEDVSYGSVTRGVGILVDLATSLHTIQNVEIENTNFGIYVREGNSINVTGNFIHNINATTNVTVALRGGIGVAFESNGPNMDKVNITGNRISDADRFGIWFGRTTGNIGADLTNISNNYIYGCTGTGLAVNRIKANDIVTVSDNNFGYDLTTLTYAGNGINIYINTAVAGENQDLTIVSNNFFATVSPTEIYSTTLFPGDVLYDIWLNNDNVFKNATDLIGTAAALETNTNFIVSDGTMRYIRNVVENAVTDAEAYHGGIGTYSKVYVTNGTFPNTFVTVDEDDIYLIAQSTAAKLQSNGVNPVVSFNNSDKITAPWASVDGFTFEFPNTAAGVYNGININTGSEDLLIQNNVFTSLGAGSFEYTGMNIFDGADNITVKNNTFTGLVVYGIKIENNNTVASVIECNTFNTSSSTSMNAIRIDEIAGPGNVNNIIVRQNTFTKTGTGYFLYSVYIDNSGAGTVSNITVGGTNGTIKAGNIFEFGTTGVYVAQNDGGIAVNYNGFGKSPDLGTAINNAIGTTLDAHFNYYQDVVVPYTTNIPARNLGAMIEWLPIYITKATLAAGDIDAVSCGFQPDITTLWVPVYTTATLGGAVDLVGNEYFLTIKDAVADANTGFGIGKGYIYLSNGTFNEGAGAITLVDPVFIGRAPFQPANLSTPNGVTITSTTANPVFDITVDGLGVGQEMRIDSLIISNSLFAQNLVSVAASVDNLIFSNNTFNLNDVAATGVSAIFFADDAASRNNHLFFSNTFNLLNAMSVKGIDYGATNTNVSSNIQILKNTFTFANPNAAADIAVRLGSVSGSLDVLGNTFTGSLYLGKDASDYTDVQIGAAGNHPTYGFAQGNTFTSTGTALTYAIRFEDNGGTGDIVNAGTLNIMQNQFNDAVGAISFDNGIVDADIDLNNIFINENEFTATMLNGAIEYTLASTEFINATNNWWNHTLGPNAVAKAPAWHDDAPAAIVANSYGYPANVAATTLFDLEHNVNFTPFWTNIAGTPGTYSGTSFAPIYNNDAPDVEYYSSLIFAIDGTNSNGTIIIKDGTYTEQNTIEDGTKNLTITSEAMAFPSLVTITSDLNDANDVMFDVTGGNVNFSYLNFVGNPSQTIDYGIRNNGAGTLTVDYCSVSGISDLVTYGIGIYNAIGGSLIVQNSTIYGNNFGGIGAANGNLIASTNTITGGSSNFEFGIGIQGLATSTITNNTITGFDANNLSGGMIFVGGGAPGIQTVTLNEISANYNGIIVGNGAADDYSLSTINNNAIYMNTVGLVYSTFNAGWVLNAENNYWGNTNGPEAAGIGATQYNAYNVGTQGNSVVGNATSTVDYLPWRRLLTTVTDSKSAGARFAPIIVANSANIPYANGFFANFTDADGQAVTNDNVYVYTGTYTENYVVTTDNTDFMGRKPVTTYNASWLTTPASAVFANTFPGAGKGAGTDAPVLTSATDILGLSATATMNTFKGFVFDLGVNAVPQSGIYLTGAAANGNSFMYTSFANAGTNDKAIDLSGFAIDGFDVKQSKFVGEVTGQATWLYLLSDGLIENITASQNDIDGAQVYMQNGAANINEVALTYNEFSNILNGITVEGVALAGVIQNVDIKNNKFKDGLLAEAALIVTGSTPNASALWSTIEFSNNLLEFTAPANVPSVGFANAGTTLPSSNIVATCNWWGDGADATVITEGPKHLTNPNGDGLDVSDNVTFTPWLTTLGNSAPFGFTPTGTCTAGERVYVNTSGNPATRTLVFPSLYAALNDATVIAGTNEYIFIDNDYLTLYETVLVPNLFAGNYYIAAETASNTWGLMNYNATTGSLTLGGTNAYNLVLNSKATIKGDLTIDLFGSLGTIELGTSDLTVSGTISNGDAARYVNTNGTGYLIKKNPMSMTQYNFPVANSGNFSPVYATLQQTGFMGTEGALLKVIANNTSDPQTLKSEGQPGYAVNTLWTLDFDKGTSVLTNTNASLIFKFGVAMQQGAFTVASSYIAVWNPALTSPPTPATAKWNSYKSVSSQNGSDGTQVTGVNLIDNVTNNKFDYAIFSGQTSFALNDEPAQAKNIIWTDASDTELKFRWSRNSTSAENWAIVAKEGSMTANSSINWAQPWNLAGDNFADGYGYTGELFYENAGALSGGNFGYTSRDFNTSSTHPGGAANVKVVASGSYTTGQTLGEIKITGLDQGKYYEFYVANYNGVGTGVDGTANFNQNTATLNPRNRKTLPAVYLGLDFSAAFKLAYPNDYTLTVPAGTTLSGDVLTNYWYTGTICNTTMPGWVNASKLQFKNYGNNTGNWSIKYSENNFTVTTTTFFTDHTASRNITGNMNYYLVNATDGDGKVATLYDNNKQVNVIVHEAPTYTIAKAPLTKTCETNNITVTATPTSTPALTINKWQYNTGAGWTDLLVQAAAQTIVGYGDVTNANGLTITVDPVFNSTSVLQVRAVLNNTTVCYNGGLPTIETTPVSLDVYDDNPLTVTQDPATTTPVVCDGTGSVVFTTDITGLPVSATVQNWEYSIDNWVTPVTIVAGGDFAYNGTKTQLTVSNIVKATYDGMKFRVVYKNGDCAIITTLNDITLTVLDQPAIATNPVVTGTACANSASNTISISATSVANNWTNAKWYSSADFYATPLTVGAGINITKTGITSTLDLTSIPLAWNGYTFKVVFENVGAVTCATAKSVASAAITVFVSPVINDVTDQVVCENGSLPTTTLGWSGSINNVTWFYGANIGGPWTAMPGTLDGATITISGAQNHAIDIANIPYAGVGTNWDARYVRALGTNGSCDDEEVFMINVYKTPSIVTDPASQTVCAGTSATFTYDDNMNDAPVDARNTVTWQYKYGAGVWKTLTTANLLADYPLTTATVTPGAYSVVITNTDIHINGINVRVIVASTGCAAATSNGTAALTVNAAPVPPALVTMTNVKARSFTASWSEVLTALTYDYEVATDFAFTNIVYSSLTIPTVNPTVTVAIADNTLSAALKGTILYVRVRSTNACGSGPYTITTVTLLNPTATFTAATNLDFGTIAQSNCSAGKAVNVVYDDLEEDLTIVLPVDYKWSTTLVGGYNQALAPANLGLSLGAAGGSTTIYVQFCPTNCGVLDGNTAFDDQVLANTTITGSALAMTGTGIAAAPTTAASALYFTADNANDFTFNWTNGNGLSRIVVIEQGAATWTPTDDVDYSAGVNTDITVATAVAPTTWVVADGAVSGPLTVTGLTAGTVYYAYVYEYNSCTGSFKYNTTPAVSQVYRLSIPAIASPQTSHTPFNMTVNLLDRAAALIANNVANPLNVTLTPASGVLTTTSNSIAAAANTTGSFSQTYQEEDGTFSASITASTATLGVLPGTSNVFTLYAQEPTTQARVILWVGTPTCLDLNLTWTNGNGTRRLVLARKNALPEDPTDLNTYTANLAYGSGDVIGTGTYAIGNIVGTGSGTNKLEHIVVNSSGSGTYYFRVIEYKGIAGLENYLVTTATFNPRSRSMSCKDMNDFAGIDVTDFNLTSAEANALVTFRSTFEQNIAGFEINRLDLANANPTFENIGTYTFNKELEAIGNTTTGKAYSFVDKSNKLMVGKTYVYQVIAVGFDGSRYDVAEGDITINNNDAVAGAAMSISDVTVNHTTINFDVAVATNSAVTISVYDINGNLLSTIADGKQIAAGITSFNHSLNTITSGTYVLVVDAGSVVATQRFQIVK